MKTHVEPWRELFAKIDDAIDFSGGAGLPLESIELTEGEWTLFLWAHEYFKVARSKFRGTQESMRVYKEAQYLGTKIYKENT